MTLNETAREILADGKGILAADESTGTITKRLEAVGVESTEDTRRRFRDLLFTTKDVENSLGGVILYDETVRQDALDGTGMVDLLRRRGIVPGIKVDGGAKDLAGFPGEKVTEGLDGLRERFAEYAGLGLRFAKWRSVISVSGDLPTATAVELNAAGQARYAALAQEAGLVPIVEPESIMDGDHGIVRSAEVTEEVLAATVEALRRQRVALEGVLVKTNMVVSGYAGSDQAGPEEVADRTLEVLHRTIPAAVPGIVFLSGGQDDAQANANLDAIARRGPQPWIVSFSYARALQGRPMSVWAGAEENVASAQDAFAERLRLTGAANRGEWTADAERAGS
ncbi:fructose-bisphosphate aldolase [Actinomycetospora succinea]|uniref:Probable fructose-bisphosphate aldolase class 1 n=1 Tax=Actinomycetospora succinea TaxID=663603 RepID=A0A4R6V1G4_9PSEU|nr:class I fructose-bisphosphate aldolase [Actinomycetospora succinea]TDQ51845.1 fructose-bisphosphate aldolase [Actinomycetospora succinea]